MKRPRWDEDWSDESDNNQNKSKDANSSSDDSDADSNSESELSLSLSSSSEESEVDDFNPFGNGSDSDDGKKRYCAIDIRKRPVTIKLNCILQSFFH